MRNSRIEVKPISGAGGAEITGVDVSQPLDDGTVGEIREALNEHCVVFFRDQEIDTAQHKAFAKRFGPIFLHPNFATVMADPEVVMVHREPTDLSYVGEIWHTDTTMVAEPPMGAILYGIDVPPYGGDTMFANQYQAYDALSPAMKRLLEGLRAVHSDRHIAGPQASRNKERSTKNRDDAGWRETRNTHPIVRTHPETGRKCLFVNGSYTIGIEGMSDAESRGLLDFLLEHGHRPEFTFRFRWHKGSIAFWDNRSTKHIALGDTGPFRRLMRRIQIGGAGVPV
ncbi:MAG TPA: TauD/TfdA family dioxygenase [Reyranella sp.]|nr:TauD/TfdA family dioxygenase [Reyranella sp.]